MKKFLVFALCWLQIGGALANSVLQYCAQGDGRWQGNSSNFLLTQIISEGHTLLEGGPGDSTFNCPDGAGIITIPKADITGQETGSGTWSFTFYATCNTEAYANLVLTIPKGAAGCASGTITGTWGSDNLNYNTTNAYCYVPPGMNAALTAILWGNGNPPVSCTPPGCPNAHWQNTLQPPTGASTWNWSGRQVTFSYSGVAGLGTPCKGGVLTAYHAPATYIDSTNTVDDYLGFSNSGLVTDVALDNVGNVPCGGTYQETVSMDCPGGAVAIGANLTDDVTVNYGTVAADITLTRAAVGTSPSPENVGFAPAPFFWLSTPLINVTLFVIYRMVT